MKEPIWLEFHEVVAIQAEILVESGGTPGILNKGAIESTLNKSKNRYYYCDGVTLVVCYLLFVVC